MREARARFPGGGGLDSTRRYMNLPAPDRHAAAGEHVSRAVIGLDLRVVAPQISSRAGVKRHHGIERRAGDQLVADQDRRDLEFLALQQVGGPALEIAGMVGPGRDQLVDIPRRDLV